MIAAPEAPMEIDFSPTTLICTIVLCVVGIIIVVKGMK